MHLITTIKCNLQQDDRMMYELIKKEKARQNKGIHLIASENVASPAVLECLGSCLTNKYAEGTVGKRYYAGNEYIDEIENLAMKRTLEAFNLNKEQWDVNLQPYSGSNANMAVMTGLLNPGDRIMGLSLKSGGHLSHGHYTKDKKVSGSSIYFESMSYDVNKDGYIDYDNLHNLAKHFKPRLVICGYSAYSRDLEYHKFRKIANMNHSLLLCDMSHYSGFVASGLMKSPFDWCDIVTSTTHKTLGGPRAGMIFSKKENSKNVNFGVFPALQGGPHENQIAAIGTQMKYVKSVTFKNYMVQVLKNSRALADEMMKLGYHVCTNGTDNHIVLVDLSDKKVNGRDIEILCEYVGIYLNKNTVATQTNDSANVPMGIRLGTAYMTSQGHLEPSFRQMANFIDRCIKIVKKDSIDLKDIENLKNEVYNYN